jgi:hypothetical protein
LALYVLTGGEVLRGFMVQTIADRLGIKYERAEAMAIAAAEAGLVGQVKKAIFGVDKTARNQGCNRRSVPKRGINVHFRDGAQRFVLSRRKNVDTVVHCAHLPAVSGSAGHSCGGAVSQPSEPKVRI